MNRMHHPKADVDRLYVKRSEGGRGLIQIENSYKLSTIGLGAYLKDHQDCLLRLVYKHENNKKMYSIHKESQKFKSESKEIVVPETTRASEEKENPNTERARMIKTAFKDHLQKKQVDRWESEPLHGQYPKRVNQADVDKQRMHNWLKGTGLKSETERLIVAAQDQALSTRYYERKIQGKDVDIKCRMCGQYDETIDHIVAGCPVLAKKEFVERHNRVHCKHYGANSGKRWYEHETEKVVDNKRATIYGTCKLIRPLRPTGQTL